MVKFLISFLFSFKSFPENGVQFFIGNEKNRSGQEQSEKVVRFKIHPDRKNICNITYLIPGPKDLIEKKITVACWSSMLKVYTKREDYNFRTECYGDKTWAAFSVKQKVEMIKIDQFKSVFPRSLEFYFNEEQKYVQRFRNEQYGAYLSINMPKGNRFGPILYVKEGPKHTLKQRSTLTVQVSKKETVTSLKSKPETTRYKPSDPEICKIVAEAHLYKIIKAMKQCSQECMTPKTPSNCSMFLPVSHLFHDKMVWVLRSDRAMSKNIQDVFVFVTAYDFLNDEARRIFNPFSINIQSLQYLPVKELQEEGINKLFVEYELKPVIPTTRTKPLLLRRNCLNSLEDIKVFLTDKFSPLSIVSCFQSKKLYVRVVGIKDTLPQKSDNKNVNMVLYGGEIKDDRFSSCIKIPLTKEDESPKFRSAVRSKLTRTRSVTKRQSSAVSRAARFKSKKREDQQLSSLNNDSHVLIGTARIDLSPLVFGNSSVIAYEQLSSRPVMIESPQKADLEHLCITLVHEDLCQYESGIIKNTLLIQNNVLIKVIAKCGFLLTPAYVNMDPSINYAFSRVIIILQDKDFATEILQTILKRNKETLDMYDFDLPLVPFRKMYKVIPPPPLKSILVSQKEPSSSDEEYDSKNQTDIITPGAYFTGFCVDCVNKILMYIEAPTINTFPSLLTELISFNTSQGRILYSSDLIYDRRIYDDFKHFGGVYCIAMKSTVDDFLNKGFELCHGVSVPEPAWKALKLISNLLDCKHVLEAVQNNYLPRPEQLISFDIEFGIPSCIIK